jgi:hypothetical protein
MSLIGVLDHIIPCDDPTIVPFSMALRERHFEQSHKIREVKS